MDTMLNQFGLLAIAGVLLILNGFFVAAEFALVKMRSSRVDFLVSEGKTFSKTLAWHTKRLDGALAACQLGITLASLALGWIGEPALAGLIEGPLKYLGIGSPVVVHTTAFILAFTLFTALHITIGEQVPKIYAIRRPEPTALICALPLKFFYIISYPFLVVLNAVSNFLLRRLGLHGSGGHEEPHTEDEIRHLLTASRTAGELSKTEHKLMSRVLEFDEMIARQVMIPRKDVVMLDVDSSSETIFKVISDHLHSRYPVYEEKTENAIGLVHVKDLAGISVSDALEIRNFMRPIDQIPETMSITKLLNFFQTSNTHMALVNDEYGSIVGAVTIEDILEELVGSIQDEFDTEPDLITKDSQGAYLILGLAPLDVVNLKLDLDLTHADADTISGYVVDGLDRQPVVGDTFVLAERYKGEVLEVEGTRATKLRLVQKK